MHIIQSTFSWFQRISKFEGATGGQAGQGDVKEVVLSQKFGNELIHVHHLEVASGVLDPDFAIVGEEGLQILIHPWLYL